MLTELKGDRLFTAMVVVAEFGDVTHFRCAKQAAGYAGADDRGVPTCGSDPHRARIQAGFAVVEVGVVEAAMKLVSANKGLGNFYQRIRKRSGAKIARVAAASKLAEICYKRLVRWHRENEAQSVNKPETLQKVPA